MEKKNKLKRWMMAMTGIIMSLLGFSSCSDEEHADMYGTPYTEFELKGKVTDADGNPVESALISIKEKVKHGDRAGQYVEVYSYDPTSSGKDRRSYSNVDGSYLLNASPFYNQIRVICTPANTDLAADSTEIEVTYTKKKGHKDDGWYIGSYEGVVNFTLKKK